MSVNENSFTHINQTIKLFTSFINCGLINNKIPTNKTEMKCNKPGVTMQVNFYITLLLPSTEYVFPSIYKKKIFIVMYTYILKSLHRITKSEFKQ